LEAALVLVNEMKRIFRLYGDVQIKASGALLDYLIAEYQHITSDRSKESEESDIERDILDIFWENLTAEEREWMTSRGKLNRQDHFTWVEGNGFQYKMLEHYLSPSLKEIKND